jgi:hypothetical protein
MYNGAQQRIEVWHESCPFLRIRRGRDVGFSEGEAVW